MRSRWVSLAATAALAVASPLASGCNAVLGLEPLSGEPPADTNGAGAAGSGAAQAGSSSLGSAAGSVNGGTSSFGGGSGSSNSEAGSGGTASASGGSPASAGAAGSQGGTEPSGGSSSAGGDGSAGNNGGSNNSGGMSGGSGGNMTGSGGMAGDSCPAPLEFRPQSVLSSLTNTCWKTSASDCGSDYGVRENQPENTLDGDLQTRFTTGMYMSAGSAFEYQIDLRTVVNVGRVVLTSKLQDWARQLSIYVSTDGKSWQPVACGSGAVVTDFWFQSTQARYIKLVQGGIGPGWWSIHELEVYGDGSDTCVDYVGARILGVCGVVHKT
jgi:hypothetical protein